MRFWNGHSITYDRTRRWSFVWSFSTRSSYNCCPKQLGWHGRLFMLSPFIAAVILISSSSPSALISSSISPRSLYRIHRKDRRLDRLNSASAIYLFPERSPILTTYFFGGLLADSLSIHTLVEIGRPLTRLGVQRFLGDHVLGRECLCRGN